MNKDIDVVLSGSGVKMMAFAGALKAIEESGYTIKRIAGTSGGSIIASMYAVGLTPDQIKEFIMTWNYRRMILFSINPISWFHWGLLSSKGIQKFLERIYGKKTFSDKLRCDLVCTGSNISLGQTDYFRSNDTYKNMSIAFAARISSTVPLVMAYVSYKNSSYVDGGLYNNYPVNIFDDNCRPTIGIKLGAARKKPRKINTFNPFAYVVALLESSAEASERQHVENSDWARTVQIDANQITDALNYNLNKEQKEALFELGYKSTKDQLKRIMGS